LLTEIENKSGTPWQVFPTLTIPISRNSQDSGKVTEGVEMDMEGYAVEGEDVDFP